MTVANGADELDMDVAAVVDVIARLAGRNFDKSMVSEVDPAIWQDFYKPVVGGRELHIKFSLDREDLLLLISFKANPA